MQHYQPFGKLAFESRPSNVYYETIPSYTRIIGEGEVNSIFIPDGSMQMYFIPTIRYDYWQPYPNTPSIDKNNSTEYWFVRNVTFPISTTFNNQLPNLYGDRLSTEPLNPDNSANSPFSPKFYQRFHNDNSTSTTDILYFYPTLRQHKFFPNSEMIQTNTPTGNCNISYDAVNKQPCNCQVTFKLGQKEINAKCICQQSASAMSIDSIKYRSSQQSINKKNYHHSRYKNPNRKCKRRDHICECNIGVKNTADKLITTYKDRASGNIQRKGRDTQTTQKSKRSDIKTEVWVPIKRKTITKSNPSTNTLNECASCGNNNCACASTTDTDSQ